MTSLWCEHVCFWTMHITNIILNSSMVGIQIQDIWLGESYKSVRYQSVLVSIQYWYQSEVLTSVQIWYQSSSSMSPESDNNWSCFSEIILFLLTAKKHDLDFNVQKCQVAVSDLNTRQVHHSDPHCVTTKEFNLISQIFNSE